jgi:hypothetical protein
VASSVAGCRVARRGGLAQPSRGGARAPVQQAGRAGRAGRRLTNVSGLQRGDARTWCRGGRGDCHTTVRYVIVTRYRGRRVFREYYRAATSPCAVPARRDLLHVARGKLLLRCHWIISRALRGASCEARRELVARDRYDHLWAASSSRASAVVAELSAAPA